MMLEDLIQKYNISKEAIEKNAIYKTENGYKTSAKELIGNAIIKERFPKWKQIKNKKMQKCGADFETEDGIFIDLKCCVGPDYHKTVPVEIYQNGIFTNTKNKLTDYLLYVIIDKYGTNFYLYDYKDIVEISKQHRKVIQIDKEKDTAFEINPGPYKYKTSANGSGIFISMPVDLYENKIRKI